VSPALGRFLFSGPPEKSLHYFITKYCHRNNFIVSIHIPIPKQGNAKECPNYCTIALISHASIMLKILHARPPCPSPTPRVYTNSCPLSRWYHPTISFSVVPLSSHLQSFPASGSFQMSQFFTSGGQSIGVLASISVLPMNTQDWSPLGWTGWISMQSRDSEESSPTPQFKSINSSVLGFLYSPTLTPIHDYWKNHSLD